jgi:hypothetical protein
MKGELHISAREATACTYLPDDTVNNVQIFHGDTNLVVPLKGRHLYGQLAKDFRLSEFNPFLKKMKEGFSIFLGNICAFMVTQEELKSFTGKRQTIRNNNCFQSRRVKCRFFNLLQVRS